MVGSAPPGVRGQYRQRSSSADALVDQNKRAALIFAAVATTVDKIGTAPVEPKTGFPRPRPPPLFRHTGLLVLIVSPDFRFLDGLTGMPLASLQWMRRFKRSQELSRGKSVPNLTKPFCISERWCDPQRRQQYG